MTCATRKRPGSERLIKGALARVWPLHFLEGLDVLGGFGDGSGSDPDFSVFRMIVTGIANPLTGTNKKRPLNNYTEEQPGWVAYFFQ